MAPTTARRAVFATACAISMAGVLAAAGKQPNIVWIMADDLGYGEVGVYPCTSPHGRIATPTLDQFASEGMQFTDAYAGYTVCAPSRTALFTGFHSGQYVKRGLSGTSLSPGQYKSTAEHLNTAGYATGAFGKTAPLVDPLNQGFDAFSGQINQAACHNMYPDVWDVGSGQQNLSLNTKPKNRTLCMANPSEYNYTVDLFNDHAMSWLNDQVTSSPSTPFFLYLSFTVPHAGGWTDAPADKEQGAPVPSDGQYAPHSGSWPDVEVDHAAVITYLDGKVAEVMKTLKDLGVDDNTAIFFASDNGAHLEGGHDYKFFNSTGGLLGHKRSLYEGGVRSPSMVRWPGVVTPGSISSHQWAFEDVMPTLLDIAGRPDLTPTNIDGISIAPTLRGDTASQTNHSYLYWTWRGTGVPPLQDPMQEIFMDGNGKGVPGYGVRVGDWKGVVPNCADGKTKQPSQADQMMLYDLAKDPFETTDVSKANQDIVMQIKSIVIAANLTCQCYQC